MSELQYTYLTSLILRYDTFVKNEIIIYVDPKSLIMLLSTCKTLYKHANEYKLKIIRSVVEFKDPELILSLGDEYAKHWLVKIHGKDDMLKSIMTSRPINTRHMFMSCKYLMPKYNDKKVYTIMMYAAFIICDIDLYIQLIDDGKCFISESTTDISDTIIGKEITNDDNYTEINLLSDLVNIPKCFLCDNMDKFVIGLLDKYEESNKVVSVFARLYAKYAEDIKIMKLIITSSMSNICI